MALKQLVWLGSSSADLKALPSEVKDDVGYALYQAQLGCFPDGAKPFKGLNGVIEIIVDFDKNTYRAVYATKLGDKLYVLHVFQKKSKSGIKTPKEDVELIERRFKTAKLIAKGGI
jgi:phage-related protein